MRVNGQAVHPNDPEAWPVSGFAKDMIGRRQFSVLSGHARLCLLQILSPAGSPT